MTGAVGFLETTGLTPAMVALDEMLKTAAVKLLQLELNDLLGVCLKLTGSTADVQTAMATGRRIADQMGGRPVVTVLTQAAPGSVPAIQSKPEFSPLIQQLVVWSPDESSGSTPSKTEKAIMAQETPMALGFIETQGFTAVFEAVDAACKAASVEVVGKEKLGGGYVTVVIQGQLSAVSAAIASGKEKVDGLGKLIAAHVIARPSDAVLKLLPKLQ